MTTRTGIKKIQGLPQCWINFDIVGWQLYMIYVTCSLLVIPALLIAACYAHIVYTIWSKSQLVARYHNEQRQAMVVQDEIPPDERKMIELNSSSKLTSRSLVLNENCTKLVRSSLRSEDGIAKWICETQVQSLKLPGKLSSSLIVPLFD